MKYKIFKAHGNLYIDMKNNIICVSIKNGELVAYDNGKEVC